MRVARDILLLFTSVDPRFAAMGPRSVVEGGAVVYYGGYGIVVFSPLQAHRLYPVSFETI